MSLFDNCAECDQRARQPLDAMMNLDQASFQILWTRMCAVEADEPMAVYRSGNEAQVANAMNLIRILLNRHKGVMTT